MTQVMIRIPKYINENICVLQGKKKLLENEQKQMKQREDDIEARLKEIHESDDEKADMIRELHARVTKANNLMKKVL